MGETYLANVRQQYEQLPYPPRDPAEEKRRLLEVEIDRLATINFHCFEGRKDFTGARVLVAGGGTGDSAIYLAEQLRTLGGEVVYLDISAASLAVARARAETRKLGNIVWKNASILDLAPETFGSFDYISCTGVLHHLEDPAAGLQKLKSVLKPGGAMGIMLYAKYGRTGVYQMQKLMRFINRDEPELAGKIANTRLVLDKLPPTNWFRHNERFLSDHTKLGDSGLVDLLLHEQDVAYGIDEVHALLASADLHLAEFSNVALRMSYRPEQYISDPVLLQKIAKLDRAAQQSVAELLVGAFRQHSFYATESADTRARLGELSDVPFFMPVREGRALGPKLAAAMRQNPTRLLPVRHESGYEFDLVPDPLIAAILNHVDGARDWRQIFSLARADLGGLQQGDTAMLEAFRPTFDQFSQFDWLFLRAGNIAAFADTVEMQAESARR